MSVITHGELFYGACRSRRREEAQKALRDLATMISVLPLTLKAGERYGETRSELEQSGRPIGNDLWIAAHALALGIAIVTNNTREFTRIPGRQLENWAEGAAPSSVRKPKRKFGTRKSSR